MSDKKKYFYPVTKKTIHKYARDIFAPIQRDECATTVWVPMAGRRKHNRFIIENISFFSKELPHFDKYLLVYVEPLDLTEESLAGYVRLMGRSFIDTCKKNKKCEQVLDIKDQAELFYNEEISYAELLTSFRHVLSKMAEKGFRVVFFLGEFDELEFANKVFYNNLKSLWSNLYPTLQYVFLMRGRVTRQENIDKWGDLNEVILQNIIHISILSEKDTDYMIDRLSHEFSLSFPEDQIKTIIKLCGGHPYTLKAVFRALSSSTEGHGEKLEALLLNHYELKSIARGIFDIRTDNEKLILNKIAKGLNIDGISLQEEHDFLVKMRYIIYDARGKSKLFGKLFENAALSYIKKGVVTDEKNSHDNLSLDEETGAIILGEKTIEEKFSHQEYAVLSMFLKKKGVLRSRDDIGNVLWGKESYEKYSNWAIDQLISKLRKKLNKMNVKQELVTIRGKGYKLVSK